PLRCPKPVRIWHARQIFHLDSNSALHNRFGNRVARDRQVGSASSSNGEKRDDSEPNPVLHEHLHYFDRNKFWRRYRWPARRSIARCFLKSPVSRHFADTA